MASSDDESVIPVTSDDPAVEIGQLPDERQFVAAVQPVDGGWMAVVHFVSADGDHLDTEHSSVIDGGDAPPDEVRAELEKMLRRLEPYRADAATVAGFEIEIGGRTIGLRPDRESGGMRLEPGGPALARASGG